MEKIDSTYLSYKCLLKWSDLKHSEDGSFCNKCQREIYDLTDCSIEDIAQLQREKGAICGLVPVIAASALLALASCSPKDSSEPEVLGKICPVEQDDSNKHLSDEKGKKESSDETSPQ